jgi:uncharacterized protein
LKDKKLYQDIKTAVDFIKVFDTHEHLIYESEWKDRNIDFYNIFLSYVDGDLLSSGLSPEDLDKLTRPEIDLEEKWKIFYPYWNLVKNTNYSKSAMIILEDLFLQKTLDYETTVKVTSQLKKEKGTKYFHKILREKAGIEYILNDIDPLELLLGINQLEPDYDYFLPIFRVDEPIMISSKAQLEKMEKASDIAIYSFTDYLKYIDTIFEKRLNSIYGIKIGIAYGRDINFADVSSYDAEKAFGKLLNLKKYNWHKWHDSDNISIEDLRPFHDYMFHYFIKKAIDKDLPIQIHTGMLAGIDNDISNANPTKLIDIILKYKQARFDLFHTGYPYSDELICMVKAAPNCYFNMCWMPYISKTLYKNILNLAIELIPSSKIFGFGGDTAYVEISYAALKIARQLLVEVLYDRIKESYFSFEEALEFANRILSENPKKVYIK